jgi:hypothetical protein
MIGTMPWGVSRLLEKSLNVFEPCYQPLFDSGSLDWPLFDIELDQIICECKRVVTRSRSVGRNPFAGRSMSERTEETALLPEDEARRMDLDDIILVVDAQMPVCKPP